MLSFVSRIRSISANLMVLAYSAEDISKIFPLLASFIKTAPESYFETPTIKKSFQGVPLFLTDKGKDALQKHLTEFPDILRHGRLEMEPGFGKTHANFLYTVGQFLTAVASKLGMAEIKLRDKFDEYKADVQKLYSIWGSEEDMNPYALFERFKSKSNSAATKEIEEKLSKSAEIMEKLKKMPI